MFFTLLLHVMLGIVLIAMARMYIRGDASNLMKEPIALTFIGLLMVHSVIPLLRYPFGQYRYPGGGYPTLAYFYAVILVFIFLFAMTAAYSCFGRTARDAETPALWPLSPMSRLYLVLFLIVPGLLSAAFFYRVVSSFGYAAYMSDRITFGTEHGGLPLLICHALYTCVMVCYAGYVASRSKGLLMTTMFFALFTLLYFGYLGNRHSVFLAYMATSGIFLLTKWRPGYSLLRLLASKQVVLMGSVFIAMVIVGEIRKLMVGMQLSTTTYTAVEDALEGGFGNHENVVWLAANDFETQYGKTYLAGLLSPIPRVFWPEKPVGAGPTLKNFVFPGSYEVGRHGISSVTTGMVTEAYMNGGILGVGLMGIVTGILLRLLSMLRPFCTNPWSISVYCYTVVIFAFSMTYAEFLGTYSRWLIDTVPLLVGWFLCRSPAPEPVIYSYTDAEALSTYARSY